MRIRTPGIAAATLALVLAVPAIAARTRTSQVVNGRLAAQDDSEAAGRFRFETFTKGDRVKESMHVWAEGLDATEDDGGELPDYNLWLIDESGATEADFGTVRLRANGKARFRWKSTRDDYPEDVDEVRDFAGGTVELRDAADDVILSGDIPDYIGVDDDNERGTHSRVTALGERNLNPVEDGSRARGRLVTRYQNRPRGTQELLLLVARRLDRGRYTLVAIDADSNETDVGTLQTRGREGIGELRLDSRLGTDIPGGGVLALGGQRAELRDQSDAVVLRGRFPDLL